MATVSIDGATPRGVAPRRRVMERASRLAERFLATVANTELFRDITSCAGIPGLAGPKVTHIELGVRPYLMVQPLPGQLVGDFQTYHERIAAGLGVARVKITVRPHGLIKIQLDPPDPLGNPVPFAESVDSGLWPIDFGGLEDGSQLRESLRDCGHLAAQGQTRSGKTRWAYSVLGQLAGANGIEIAGIDPTSKLLGPWQGHPQGTDRLCASADYAEMEHVSHQLVADMRARIRDIPRNQDVLPIDRDHPLRLVVLEEWPNALTIASIAKNKAKGLDTELGKNIQMLLAESHKAGWRVLLMAQRMDGGLIGTFNRDNISHRFSFRTASKEGLRMLHEGIEDQAATDHAVEAPGIAYVQSPTTPLQRLRAGHVPEYSDYLNRVDSARHGAVNTAA